MATFAEILGYIGMALIVGSFLFKNIKAVRIVNIVGSVLSATFALILILINKNTEQLPTLILNASLIIVNVLMLIQGSKKSESK